MSDNDSTLDYDENDLIDLNLIGIFKKFLSMLIIIIWRLIHCIKANILC